jgi:hypothetical protein
MKKSELRQIIKEEIQRMQKLAGIIKENQIETFEEAGFEFDDGILGGVGSGGAGYYDQISDRISGFNLDKFNEKEFEKWYGSFSKNSFNKVVYSGEDFDENGIDFSMLPKGIHQLEDLDGAAEVTEDQVILYAYPTLGDDMGEERIPIFGLDNNGKVVTKLPKEEVKAKLSNNEYAII